MTYPRILLAAVTVPLLIAGFTACSGASNSAPPTKATKTVSEQDWRLAHAKCMRAAGHDVQDPSPDGKGQGIGLGDGDSVEKFAADDETCKKKVTAQLGELPALPTDEKAMEEGREQEDCLRKEGVDVEEGKALDLNSIPAGVQEKCGIDGDGSSGRTTR